MIVKVMNKSISILCNTYEIKGRRPRYINLWTLPRINAWLQSKGVPKSKTDILIEIYKISRFGE